jgi:predicted amidophosphoribosyltransferase
MTSDCVDWTEDINVRDQAVGMCPGCGQESGGGKFCAHCGAPLAAAPVATKKFCTICGSQLGNGKFCSECGTAV